MNYFSKWILFFSLCHTSAYGAATPTSNPAVPPASLVYKSDWITDHEAKLTLARIYSYHKRTYLDALQLYQEVLAEDPGNPTLLLEMGRIYLNEKEFCKALEILNQVQNISLNKDNQLLLAQYESDLGYAFSSQSHFEDLMRDNPDQEDLLIHYADAMMSWGNFYQAECIYEEALKAHPDSIDMITRVVDVLVGTQRFEEAEEMCEEELQAHPTFEKVLLGKLVNIKWIQKLYGDALCYMDQLIALDPKKREYALTKARILYDAESYLEALPLFESLKNDPDYNTFAFLGAGKCHLKLKDEDKATIELKKASQDTTTAVEAHYYLAGSSVLDDAFIQEIKENGSSSQEIQMWIDCYSQGGYNEPIRKLYETSTTLDPDYFPAQVGFAESLTGELDFGASLGVYERLLEDFPIDAKLLLGQARVTAYNKCYRESLCLYQHLIDLNTDNPVPKLEQARVAYWGKYYHLSLSLYEKLLDDTNDCEDWALSLIHERIQIEYEIVQLKWNNRLIHSLCLYQEAMELDPTNDFWKFENAQTLCSLGLCDESMCIYQDILHKSPMHTLSGIAYDRELNHEDISIASNSLFWQEMGYGDLNQIARYESNLMVHIPLSCQEHIRLYQRYWDENTFFDSGFHQAEGQTAEWNRCYNEYFSAAAALTYKHYFKRFDSTWTGFGSVGLNLNDYARLNLSYTKSDVVVNYFNLVQKTQQSVWAAALQSDITHYLSANGLFEYIKYNDHNSEVHGLISGSYAFTDHPRVLKLGLIGEYRNTAKLNIFIYGPNNELLNIIYPYWTPQDYFFGQAQIEWRHDYGFLEFCGAPIQFYDIKIAGGDDSQNNYFWEIKTEWQHEFYRHWKICATWYIHRSPQWNGDGAWLTLAYEF